MAACGATDDSCKDDTSEPRDAADVADAAPEVVVDVSAEPAPEEVSPPTPTYWSEAATAPLVKDDLAFARYQGQKVFALGFDAKKGPTYDGFTTEGCDEDEGVGYVDDVLARYDRALEAGANFTFVRGYPGADWTYYDAWLDRISLMYGKWYDGFGRDRPAERDVLPIVYNEWGESDFDNPDVAGTIVEH